MNHPLYRKLERLANAATAEYGEQDDVARILQETVGRLRAHLTRTAQQPPAAGAPLIAAPNDQTKYGNPGYPTPPPPPTSPGYERRTGRPRPGVVVPKAPEAKSVPKAIPAKYRRDVNTVARFLRSRGVTVT